MSCFSTEFEVVGNNKVNGQLIKTAIDLQIFDARDDQFLIVLTAQDEGKQATLLGAFYIHLRPEETVVLNVGSENKNGPNYQKTIDIGGVVRQGRDRQVQEKREL